MVERCIGADIRDGTVVKDLCGRQPSEVRLIDDAGSSGTYSLLIQNPGTARREVAHDHLSLMITLPAVRGRHSPNLLYIQW